MTFMHTTLSFKLEIWLTVDLLGALPSMARELRRLEALNRNPSAAYNPGESIVSSSPFYLTADSPDVARGDRSTRSCCWFLDGSSAGISGTNSVQI
jgi:hypothetical protein